MFALRRVITQTTRLPAYVRAISTSTTQTNESTSVNSISPDYEIRRHADAMKTNNTMIGGRKDWMDVLDDAAEVEEAIRAFKEDSLVLGLHSSASRVNTVTGSISNFANQQ
jgi:hypothetical protein